MSLFRRNRSSVVFDDAEIAAHLDSWTRFEQARKQARTPERKARARDQWIDPGTLRKERYRIPYGPAGMPACGGCGHPRWAHADDLVQDGLCILDCAECGDKAGYQPGYPA